MAPVVALMNIAPTPLNQRTPTHWAVVACCEANEQVIASCPTMRLPCTRFSVVINDNGVGLVALVVTVSTLIT